MNDLHPGDAALDGVLRLVRPLFTGPGQRTEERLSAFLKPRLIELQRRNNESKADYSFRLMRAFTGPRWMLLRHMIAVDYTNANMQATEHINDGLPVAFMAGMNESTYVLSMSDTEMWPVTAGVVASLVAAGVITLNKRKLKKTKDVAYLEKRTQSAINGAIVRGIQVKNIPMHVANALSKARLSEIIAYARASIYGASDSGAYIAGLEAERMGVEIEKSWLGIMDVHIRPSHKHLHGTTIPLHDKFHGYHGDLRYPHDPEAPPQEIYRCRCRMAVHLRGNSPGEYSRKILPTQTAAYRKWRDAQIRKAGSDVELAKIHRRLIRGR